MMRDPDGLGDRVAAVLARDHGEPLARRDSDQRRAPGCGSRTNASPGRRRSVRRPARRAARAGARDPRRARSAHRAGRARRDARGAAARRAVRHSRPAEGGHSPHSERATADEVTRLVERSSPSCLRPRPLPAHPPHLTDRPRMIALELDRRLARFRHARRPRLPRARRHVAVDRRRRVRRHRRAERLRQVDAAEHRRRPAGADRRARCASTARR